MKRFSYYSFQILICFLIIMGCGCSNSNDIEKQAAEFIKRPIHIPYNKLDKRYCSMFSDSTELHKSIKMVYYVDSVGCTACEITRMAKVDTRKRDLYPDVEFVFIVNVKPSDVENAYAALCNSRILSPVYIDTLNAFMSENPNFPKSNMFHSFVINDKDSVLMVGFPFSTSRMENLFKEVIKRNIKKH